MKKRLFAALSISMLAGHASAQVFIVSASSGDWNNAATWSPPVVPGPADHVTVSAGHTVHLASAGVPAWPKVIVESLTVAGTLLSDNTPGFSADAQLELNRLIVSSGGAVVMQNGTGNSPGGSLHVFGKAVLEVLVDGSMVMGSGNVGGQVLGTGNAVPTSGSLYVHGYDVNFFPLPFSAFTSTGTIQAGSNGGWITVTVDQINILNGLLAAGDDPNLCQPGSVNLWGSQSISVGGTAEIRSGDCPSPTTAAFGLVALATSNQLSVGSGAIINARTNGCAWLWGGSSNIQGTVLAPCLNYDPPDLSLTGTGRLVGDTIKIGAANFAANSLAAPGAIDAADSIEFFVNPGGTLDLQGLAANTNWFQAANSITIHADTILTDPLISPSMLMSPPPIIKPAKPLRAILLPQGGASVFAPPGASLRLLRDVINFGSAKEEIMVDITDSGGWLLNPLNTTQPVPAGDVIRSVLDLSVPGSAVPGDHTIVTMNAVALDAPSFTEHVSFLIVVPSACPADFDYSGFVDGDDFDAFVAAFELGDPTADFDASGFTDTDDYDAFVAAFTRGC